MRKLWLLLLLAGCTTKKNGEVENRIGLKPLAEHKSTTNRPVPEFFSLFKEVSFDTLHIFSEYDGREGMHIKGSPIPAKFYSHFPKEVKLAETEWNMGPTYACYRFSYSKDITAFIVNAPSDHDATAYDLYLYSHQKDSIVHTLRISDKTGDEGSGIVQDSWLLRLNNDAFVDLVTIRREVYPEDEAMTKFGYTDKTIVYMGKNNRFDSTTIKNLDTRLFKVHSTTLD